MASFVTVPTRCFAGGPLWDDVSLSLLESELRGGMDLTNGISPVAPADLARVKRMGPERYDLLVSSIYFV